MPSSMTHAYFSMDVYEKLDDRIKEKLHNNREDLKTFSQSHDILYFCSSREVRKLGMRAHRMNTRDYFIKMINYINDHNLQNNNQVLAYLYASITHYVLDKTTHPFIVYKTGIFDRNDKSTYKYNGLHYEMEFYIDVYMIHQRERKDSNNYKVYKNIFNVNKINKELLNVIENVYHDVYEVSGVSKTYLSTIRKMKHFFHFYNYDRLGLKKQIYKIVDFFSPSSMQRKTPLSFHIPYNMKIHYLNLDKNEWNHPMVETERYDYSFLELYVIALSRAVNIIENVAEMLEKKDISDKELKVLFKDVSYLTDKDCENLDPIKYFEF